MHNLDWRLFAEKVLVKYGSMGSDNAYTEREYIEIGKAEIEHRPQYGPTDTIRTTLYVDAKTGVVVADIEAYEATR